ncbi:biopolymer transport protein ExbB [Alkalispirochaeta americana]|uniref:Biopolymer transport protein ExbB n=1 Tax=Alkalispirochaeta americana TaxID=159291 RepID=A0A1N6Q6J0_9SPIO|nr:MotA/TolQ/ExbB proton channel family protein [Alkalispirochaeta americana]SIQ12243.1 biopolymer transport protein ExbB [Alkalispirochaeta americana]
MDWFIQGGWPMYPILVSSVLALAVSAERTIYFVRSMECPQGVIRNCRNGAVADGRGELSRLATIYAASRDEPREILEKRVSRGAAAMIRELNRGLGVLSAIAHLAPLMGLFGTVLGMIGVFQGIEASGGRAEIHFLAGGIRVALFTTAFGLMVAVPSMTAFHIFHSLSRRRAERMEDFIDDLNDFFGRSVSFDTDRRSDQERDRESSREESDEDYEAVCSVQVS